MNKAVFIDDPFGVNRRIVHQIVGDLLEAWTPERKEQIMGRMKERGAALVDHVQIGDYDLVLWHYVANDIYAASLNSQEDPTELTGQIRQPKAQRLHWGGVVLQLRMWVERYGKLLIGSTLESRTQQYRRRLYRNFLVADWKEHPDAGFYILPD